MKKVGKRNPLIPSLSKEEYEELKTAAAPKALASMIAERDEAWKVVAKGAATYGKSTVGVKIPSFPPQEKTCVVPEELLRDLLYHVKALEKEVEAIKHPVYYTAGVSDKSQMSLFSDTALEKIFGKGKI